MGSAQGRPTGWSLLSTVGHLICLLLLITGCSSSEAEAEELITASGFIEGREVTVAAEVSGLISEIFVDRGDDVIAGDVVARLDDAALQSLREEADAGVLVAQANLDRVRAGARDEEIAAARAGLREAEARRDGAERAVLNARDVISNPLSLNMQISEALTQIALAEQNVELHQVELDETGLLRDIYADQGGDVERTWDLQVEATQARLEQAQAQLDGARAYLTALLAIREDPLALMAEAHGAETELELARAGVMAAEARLDELEAGPTGEEVAVAEAEVRQAEAAEGLVDAQLGLLTLTAPMDGVVSTRSAQVGETATPGKPLLTIANLDEVTLALYVPENRIGQVQIGQQVEVVVDSFPGQTFLGRVQSIAGEAEFTPRNVQTKEERVNLVFAVDVVIPNPGRALKPGMPADATIRP
jgi:HlyD family secretion protein